MDATLLDVWTATARAVYPRRVPRTLLGLLLVVLLAALALFVGILDGFHGGG